MFRKIGAVLALVLLGGCDWLGFGSTPVNSEKARPGAERQVSVTNALPAASAGRGYDAIAAVDENRGAPRIGSVVAGKGGQKAQLDAASKEANERDAKAREERARQDREAAVTKPLDGNVTPAPPVDIAPATPPAADVMPPPVGPVPGALPSDTRQ